MKEESCFKAYDIRGQIPTQLNEDVVYKIGCAYAEFLKPEKVIVGHDMRLSSRSLTDSLIKGLTDYGVNVYDIGLCGTEEVYFATAHTKFDGGIMVTASHNPKDYNGLKLIKEQAKPISMDTGLAVLRDMVAENNFKKSEKPAGKVIEANYREQYIEHLLSYINLDEIKDYNVVMNPGNGCASLATDILSERIPGNFIKIHNEPDGHFPNGIPNPLLPENRGVTIDAIGKNKADLGIAWDGDFDRCFFFDENGRFIEGYYLVGLFAEYFLDQKTGQKIVYDPRVIWNTIDLVTKYSGIPVVSKGGHSFIKDKMRSEDAVYGGEMSAHHYFRDFSYCDSGMIPWIVLLQIMSRSGKSLSQLVDERIELYPSSGEINRTVEDADVSIQKIKDYFADDAISISEIDGVSLEFEQWRFNLRKSNTEPLLRLNVESRADVPLMEEKTALLVKLIENRD
ncbi:MAG: phosphomannomutase [Methylococcales bacterium]|jgi:phosphomannomutase|nr:phosphomannomutase [Methylococcales bacterium]MBT7408631.1 phosphomannomutase [Methylococcales bacterium]